MEFKIKIIYILNEFQLNYNETGNITTNFSNCINFVIFETHCFFCFLNVGFMDLTPVLIEKKPCSLVIHIFMIHIHDP